MQVRWAVVFLVSMGFAYAGGIETPAYSYTMQSRHHQLHRVDRIVADGYFDLIITQKNSGNPTVRTISYRQEPISIVLQNNTLYLRASRSQYSHYSSHPKVEVQVLSLNGLAVAGPVNVSMDRVKTKGLDITSSGYGKLKIKDVKKIHAITQSGNNQVMVSGIDTSLLSLGLEGSSRLTLSGHTYELFARLHDQAFLKARQLVAEHVMIQAQNYSEAHVYPVKTIRAFSADSGEIFYYKHLTDLTRYTVDSGNAFQMAW